MKLHALFGVWQVDSKRPAAGRATGTRNQLD
jgi:hypothetical protein